MLTSEDQQELIHIIENLYDFIDGGIRARRLLLARADLHQFVSRIDLSGPSDIVAQDIVDRLERKGYLSPEHPHYHALGALLSSLLKRSDLPPDQARFLASLIVRYSLVLDPAYINKLRVS